MAANYGEQNNQRDTSEHLHGETEKERWEPKRMEIEGGTEASVVAFLDDMRNYAKGLQSCRRLTILDFVPIGRLQDSEERKAVLVVQSGWEECA